MYSPILKQYTRISAAAGESKDLTRDALGFENAADESALEANARVIRSEILEVGGQPHDCWVVETRIAKSPTAGKSGGGIHDAVYTFWIDKTLGLDLQATVSGTINEPGQPAAEMRTKTVKRSLELNKDLPDSVFLFTPPEDAKETAELFAGPPESAPEQRSAPEPSAGPRPDTSSGKAPSLNEPRAFIPNLNPVVRIEPVYPAAVRNQGLQGIVKLLLTIDPQGRVTSVEPLSGREVLRPAAIDAVKQWKFPPVMRNGQPVDAYTNATVAFLNPGKPATGLDDLGFNIADEMTAGQRLAELQRKFPRSPEQVLTDAEQARSASAQDRIVALPELAKAAVDAGALDNAISYAQELLQSATDPHDWN